ncbi:MAG: polysaccharide biosynthesis tyrosine autokinase [Elusimicrobia bacterium]|nr:polysaccharide biosynthesis tyrosine autokinase [Elusimicrobiota bacterium]
MDLSHFIDMVLRRRWIILAAVISVFLVSVLVTFTTRPVYQAASLLVIEKERGGGAVFSNGAMVENNNDDYYQTQYKLLRSYSLLQRVHADLQLDKEEDFNGPNGVERLQNAVVVSPVLRTRLVYVRVDSHSPALAARIANGVSETFVQQNLANQLFISKEVLQALQLKENDINARQRLDSLPAVVNNPLIQTLKAEYVKLESQAAELSQKVTSKHPALIALRSNMGSLHSQIQGETNKIVQSLKTELSGQLRGNNVRVVDLAREPEAPVKPQKRKLLLLGLFGGLIAGLGLTLLIETLDQTVRTQEDVENRLLSPFLGLIPQSQFDKGHPLDALLSKEPSLSSEAFRNLRTMVDFAGVSQKSNALLVTSSVQEEGKTFVASNLAVVFAQLGERVLVIDGDMRRPSVHKNFQLSSEHGLSEYLAAGQSVSDIEPLIQNTKIPNLKVLACGPRPPNPSELLNTPRLAALVVWARTNFDRVIVDCTPLFPINDTLLWGRHLDSAVFIVKYGKTRVQLIQNACQRLQTSGSKLLGICINSAQAGGLAYAPYGYYYQQYYRSYHQPVASSKS